MERKENILGTEKIGKLLLTYSIPGIISMLVNSIYNLVDQIFIGQGVGYLGNGATNVAFPFTQLMLALSLMVSAGTAANTSLNLGRKDEDEACHFVGNGFALAVMFGVGLLVIGQAFLLPLLHIFGATEANLSYAIDYSRIVLIGFPFTATGIMMNDIIRADGAPQFSMMSMLVGAILNIIFDPIFIFVFHWGVKGAALATIIGQIATFALSFWKMHRLKTVKFIYADLKPQAQRLRRIMAIGMSAFLTQISMLFVTILLNNQAAKYGAQSSYGADIPVTCFGIIMKVNQIMMSVIIGITNATQPIFSFNFGACRYDRVRELVKKTAITTFVVGCVGWIVLQTFPSQIISIFGQESALYNEFAVMCCKNMTIMIFVMGIPMMAGVYFQAVGKPMQAVVLSLSRQILFTMPLMVILPLFLGVVGIMYAYPLADCFSITLATILLLREMKHLKQLEKDQKTLAESEH